MEKRDPDKERSKAIAREFAFTDALLQFTLLFREEQNERAAAIVGAAFLDTMLENILTEFFVDDEKEVERLFSPDRPLGTYGSKVSLAYCLGLIGKVVHDDLRLVGKIRNKFAHDLNVTFDDDPIRAWSLSLKWHQIAMFMPAPLGATPSDVFQVGVNQLVAHLNGIISIARMGKRQLRKEF